MGFWKRRIIVFGFLLVLAGCPLPSIAQPIYLPLILNNSVPNPTGLRNGDFELGPDGAWKESSTQKTYYFASAENRERFDRDPARYLKNQ